MSSYPVCAGGLATSIKAIIFSWSKNFNSLISRTIRFASIRSSKAFGTFFIATLVFEIWSYAEQTTPYAPCPIYFMYSNFSSTTNVVPTLKL